MNIHEYQAKMIFKEYNLPVSQGLVAFSVDEAVENAKKIGGNIWAVKAQIHAGGRGLGGGVKIAKSLDEVKSYAQQILGMTLVTHQTGAEGKLVEKIYIEAGANIDKEYYLSVVFDRANEMPVFIASTEGGMEIEKVAHESPEKVIKVGIDPSIGVRAFHVAQLAFGLNLDKEERAKFSKFITTLYEIYMKTDAQLVEINPLIKTKEGDFLALDAKVGIDDSALFRQAKILEMRDISEEDPAEYEASESNLSYVKLDGNIGCMVNGAGLAMGVMDSIAHFGGEPANFLDVGGGANPTTIAKGFEIILKDPNVKSIFVNIFGGIVRCDRVANGILEATKLIDVKVPIIVRLDGTNAKEAAEILQKANIKNVISVAGLEEGSKEAIRAAGGNK